MSIPPCDMKFWRVFKRHTSGRAAGTWHDIELCWPIKIRQKCDFFAIGGEDRLRVNSIGATRCAGQALGCTSRQGHTPD